MYVNWLETELISKDLRENKKNPICINSCSKGLGKGQPTFLLTKSYKHYAKILRQYNLMYK